MKGKGMAEKLRNIWHRKRSCTGSEADDLSEIAQALSRLYTDLPTPPQGLKPGRERVLAVAREMRARYPRPHRRPRWQKNGLLVGYAWRVVAAILLLFSLASLSTRAVWAAYNSLPGQLLYPIKVAVENQHLAYIEDPDIRLMLTLALMEERVNEVEALIKEDRPIPSGIETRIDTLATSALVATAWSDESLMPDMLGFVVRRIRAHVQTLEQLKAHADGETHTRLERLQNIYLNKGAIALAAIDHPQAFRAAYQAGKPETMVFITGGPLGGTVTPEIRQSFVTPGSSPPAPRPRPLHPTPTPQSENLRPPNPHGSGRGPLTPTLPITATTTPRPHPTPRATAALTHGRAITPTPHATPPITPPGLSDKGEETPGLNGEEPPGLSDGTPPGQDHTTPPGAGENPSPPATPPPAINPTPGGDNTSPGNPPNDNNPAPGGGTTPPGGEPAPGNDGGSNAPSPPSSSPPSPPGHGPP